MEEKTIALWILSIIVVIAIIGLVLFFRAEKTGEAIASANRNSLVPYPGGVYHPTAETYANTAGNVAPYARMAQPYLEEPGYMTAKKDPTRTPTYLQGSCDMLAKYGVIAPEYSRDATLQQSRFQDCVQVEGSQSGYCCKKDGYIY